jgi:exodeoxyribonuclease V alpha subunit
MANNCNNITTRLMKERVKEKKGENKLLGELKRIIYKHEDFHVCEVLKEDYETIKVILNHGNLKVGRTYLFNGFYQFNEKYNSIQFKSIYCSESLPDTKEGFLTFIKSKEFKGIGEARAQKIVDHLGTNPIKVLEETPEKILNVPGVDNKLLGKIKDIWESDQIKNKIFVGLQQHGLTYNKASKIYDKYGKMSLGVIESNPYRIISEIEGIGFYEMDKIAKNIGIGHKSKIRILEGIKYVLRRSDGRGSCFLYKHQIVREVGKLLTMHDEDLIIKYIENNENEIISLEYNGEIRYYSKYLYYSELNVFNFIKRHTEDIFMNEMNMLSVGNVEYLSEEQRDAVFGIFENKISILTGAPGCGKTYTTKAVVDNLKENLKSFEICAPTGKAASKIGNEVSCNAKTIHRLLKYNPMTELFEFNEKNKLEIDFLIVDECSMIPITLMDNLFKAIPQNCQILLVGDYWQLQPVSAGNPFKDMIESGTIKTYILNKIFRQAMDSDIITTAHKIKDGEVVIPDSPLEKKEIWEEKDLVFIESNYTDKKPNKKSSLDFGFHLHKLILYLYSTTIPQIIGSDNIQILIPKKKGKTGTEYINQLFQDKFNNKKRKLNFKNKVFKPGDKVIHVRNNYNLNVFNGETGEIIDINEKQISCIVRLDNDKIVEYKGNNLDDLELGYSITIHKSQGSEFDAVIIPLLSEHSIMLERSLIYTALTRAKRLVIFVGEESALVRAQKNVNTHKRQTSLKEYLDGTIEVN